MSDEVDKCDLCGRLIVEGVAWVLLNRFAIGTGRGRRMSEWEASDGNGWDMENMTAGGRLFCMSPCLQTYLSVACVEIDYANGKREP